MWILALACAFFIFLHLIISGTSLRGQIIGKVGRQPYLIAYGIVSALSLAWMTLAFTRALSDPLNIEFWDTPELLRILVFPLNLLAFLLIIIGATSASPTGVQSQKHLPDIPIHGIIRVSRHPVLAGIALWAGVHLITNPSLASWVFFGTLLVSSAAGPSVIDRKRLLAYPAVYETIMRRTSIVPFLAIAQGRVDFNVREIGFVRPFMALGIFFLITVLHEFFFSVRAL